MEIKILHAPDVLGLEQQVNAFCEYGVPEDTNKDYYYFGSGRIIDFYKIKYYFNSTVIEGVKQLDCIAVITIMDRL
jgi:hypothetical protein